MNRIAVVALLYVVASLPAFAADDASPELNLSIPSPPTDDAGRFFVERIEELGRFGLLQMGDGFALYGRLSLRRIDAIEAGLSHKAATYGLHGQFEFDGARNMVMRFGWDRYAVGPHAGGNLYLLSATIQF